MNLHYREHAFYEIIFATENDEYRVTNEEKLYDRNELIERDDKTIILRAMNLHAPEMIVNSALNMA